MIFLVRVSTYSDHLHGGFVGIDLCYHILLISKDRAPGINKI
jgi:hypothetical protein